MCNAAKALKQVTVENFPNLLKDTNLQIQEAETNLHRIKKKNLHRINPKKSVQLRHKIMLRKLRTKKSGFKGRFLPPKLWSSEGGSTVFQMLKEKNCPLPLQVTKLSFKSKEKKRHSWMKEN